MYCLLYLFVFVSFYDANRIKFSKEMIPDRRNCQIKGTFLKISIINDQQKKCEVWNTSFSYIHSDLSCSLRCCAKRDFGEMVPIRDVEHLRCVSKEKPAAPTPARDKFQRTFLFVIEKNLTKLYKYQEIIRTFCESTQFWFRSCILFCLFLSHQMTHRPFLSSSSWTSTILP